MSRSSASLQIADAPVLLLDVFSEDELYLQSAQALSHPRAMISDAFKPLSFGGSNGRTRVSPPSGLSSRHSTLVCQLIQQFRVMGDEDDLPISLINAVKQFHQPRLDFGQGDEVVRLVDEQCAILSRRRNKAACTVRSVRAGLPRQISERQVNGFFRCGPRMAAWRTRTSSPASLHQAPPSRALSPEQVLLRLDRQRCRSSNRRRRYQSAKLLISLGVC